jgi:hypothetical protein
MRHSLLAISLVACLSLAHADDGVIASCRAAMARGECSVQRDTRDYPPDATTIIVGAGGSVRASTRDYIALRNAGEGKDTPGGPKVRADMCDLAAQSMQADPGGNVAKIARAMWGGR